MNKHKKEKNIKHKGKHNGKKKNTEHKHKKNEWKKEEISFLHMKLF